MICPLRMIGKTRDEVSLLKDPVGPDAISLPQCECIKGQCCWWQTAFVREGECSILSLAFAARWKVENE